MIADCRLRGSLMFSTSRLYPIYSVSPMGRIPPPAYNVCRLGVGSTQEVEMYLVIALLLLVMWAGGFMMFHVASGLIHLLLLFAVISFVAHFLMGARTA
jgi:hypothetical protein